jgi:hypothetical protein
VDISSGLLLTSFRRCLNTTTTEQSRGFNLSLLSRDEPLFETNETIEVVPGLAMSEDLCCRSNHGTGSLLQDLCVSCFWRNASHSRLRNLLGPLCGDRRIKPMARDGASRPQIAPQYRATAPGARPHKRFYEKVINVKADVAALLNLFSDVSHRRPMVTCGAVKGAAEGRRSS